MFVCSRSIWLIWCWFLRRGENRESVEIQPVYRPPLPSEKSIFTERRGVCTQAWRKTSRSKGENQQQTQPTYGVDAEIWTRATLVGGECPYHCTTLALIETWTCAQVDFVKRWPNQNGPWWKPWRNRKDYCYQRWLLSVQTSETSGQAAKKRLNERAKKKATRQRLSYFSSKDWFVYKAKFSILFQAVRVRPARASLKPAVKRFCGLSPWSFVRLVLVAKDSNDSMAVAKVSMKQPRKKLTIKPQGRSWLVLFNVTYLKEFESKRRRGLGNSPVRFAGSRLSILYIC